MEQNKIIVIGHSHTSSLERQLIKERFLAEGITVAKMPELPEPVFDFGTIEDMFRRDKPSLPMIEDELIEIAARGTGKTAKTRTIEGEKKTQEWKARMRNFQRKK